MDELVIRLLGGVLAQRQTVPLPLGGRRVRALLAVLALSAGRTLPVDVLAARVWDEDERPARPRPALQTLVARLRQVLGAGAVVTEPTGYRLHVPREQVDVLALVDAFDRAAAATSPAQERRLLTEALDRWDAAPFGEELSEWLSRHETPRLVGAQLRALERRVDLDLEAGQHDRCAVELRSLIHEHPLRETLWVRLLRVLWADGHPADALEAYEQVRLRLANELGVDPSPALQELHQLLLKGDLPGHAADRTPVRTVPRQLPSDVPGFTGRAPELEQLDALLLGADPDSRLVTVHGPGGSGKTSLALHWANRSADRFPDGQLFLNLRGFGRGPTVPVPLALELLLRGVGVHGSDIPESVEERGARLRSELADRRMLIVLDNAESAEQVRPMLPGGPSAVIVTSRNQLRGLTAIEGAVPLTVGSMSPPEAVALVRRRLRGPSPPDERIAEVAELCGNLPIALVVAGERVAREGEGAVSALIERLRDDRARLGLLSRGPDPLTDVRGVFATTYDSLEPDGAAMFRLLALHPLAPISTGAAAALWGVGPGEAEQALDGLVELHLLRLLRPGWFDLHDLARDYAAEALRVEHDGTEEAAARRRLHSWYRHSSEAACLALGRYPALIEVGPLERDITPETFTGARRAQAWFAGHRRSLTQTIHRAVEEGDHALVCQLVPRVSYYLSLLEVRPEELALDTIALDSAQLLGTDEAIAGAANNLGIAYGRQRRTAEARECFELSIRHAESADHWLSASRARSNIALLYDQAGRHDEAVEEFTRLLRAMAERGADRREMLATLSNLANAHLHGGRPHDALARAQECRRLARQLGVTASEALAMDGVGSALLALDDPDGACRAFAEAVELYRAVGNVAGETRALYELGGAERAAGREDHGRWALTRCLRLIEEVESAGGSVSERGAVEQLLAQR
ncbi:AfsR/SARP family transcriptional regulator [Ornithinimicrobium cavernae]|uniref:AfsR/SARP family transcriptional regulator n=1 Tax=Ornithinimicrobium cavernae TaxID=2666047 RepID=UPI001379D5AD|nr:BTAD domain-containing putative transcriptional regulator [Ornithinimicrobium cavernae]